jgi:Ca2+-binding EF-hand superfamily protein
MASHDLSARDVEKGKFAFSIYDFEGNGSMDAYYLGDCLRALNLNPTNAAVEKKGGTKLRKQKYLKVEEFLPLFAEVKNAKDEGGKEDFLECLRLYDKQSDGTMLWSDLQHILISLGEALEEKVANDILAECCDPEDDDGFIPYEPFISKLIAGATSTD